MKTVVLLGVVLGSLFLFNENLLKEEQESRQPKKEKEQLYLGYKEALELAKKSGKPIMFKLTAEHCRYCKKMDKEVLADKEVRKVLTEHFIPVSIDVEKDKIPLGIKRTITPTFVFVNANREISSTIHGSWGKDDFLDLLHNRIKN